MEVIRPIIAAVMAAVLATGAEGCASTGMSMGDAYTWEVLGCIQNHTSTQAAKSCRRAVDKKYKLCPEEEWPRLSPCDY
jgi:hypothetical protein